VQGQVINAATGQPIPRALVRIQGDAETGALTDSDGRFEIPGVPTGPKSIQVAKPGYLDRPRTSASSAVEDAASPTHDVQVSAQMPDLVFTLEPTSSIHGLIELSTGDPAEGITINLLRRTIQDGRAVWTPASITKSNSEGAYRFASLADGEYVIYTEPTLENDPAANPYGAGRAGYVSVFYPDARDLAGAAHIQLSSGDQAQANLTVLARQRDKLQQSAALDPRSVSRNSLDSAIDAAKAAQTALEVAQRQLDLTKAGAWTYDIQNQQAQYAALSHSYDSAKALLVKYVVKAPADGVVMALNTLKGGYVSPQGAYDSYTETNLPAAVLGSGTDTLNVRCYVDEILLNRLPKGKTIKAQMSIRGANVQIPLQFVRIQPYVTPKIELSNERQEQVDLRVLPVIFRFHTDPKIKLYPGEEVDVYISQ